MSKWEWLFLSHLGIIVKRMPHVIILNGLESAIEEIAETYFRSVYLSIYISMALRSFFGPWSLFSFLIHTQQTARHLLTLVPCSRIFLPWIWRRQVPPKRRFTQDLHGAISQKTVIFFIFHSFAFPPFSRYTALPRMIVLRRLPFSLFFILCVLRNLAQEASHLNCFWMRLVRIRALLTSVLLEFPQYLDADVGIVP
jgi:hypothetical protein